MANGRVTGSLGTPADEPEVQLKMSADVLDGMFTGRINAMQEAMEGRLSFTGDAAKAMTLQQLQRDLMRLYTAAREEIGDPGDLASLTTASTAGGDTNGMFCWIDDPLQAPIESWEPPSDNDPWMRD